MLKILKKILTLFSPYAHPLEKRFDRFLSRISKHSNSIHVQQQLLSFMKENVAIVHLWCERRYKGYKYLKRGVREKLYKNIPTLIQALNTHRESHQQDFDHVLDQFQQLSLPTNIAQNNKEEILYLSEIMSFFRSKSANYTYREGGNFGGLLRNPAQEALIGDCNQMVTLYAFFFNLKFDLTQLSIKTYPGHVCLHFKGVDIECTNGTFQNYKEAGQKVLPITELMSVNILDVSDTEIKQHSVSAHAFLDCAKLAFLISSNREIVSHNLEVAYHNVVTTETNANNFSSALKYAKESQKEELITLVSHNAAVHYLNKNEFSKAHKYANNLNDQKLKTAITENEGIYHYKKENYEKALYYFKKTQNQELIKQCYSSLFMKLQKKVDHIKTIPELKKHRSTLQKMKKYADLSHNHSLQSYIQELLSQL